MRAVYRTPEPIWPRHSIICDNGIPFVTMVSQTEPSKRTNAPAVPRPLFKGRRSAMAFVLGTGLHDYKEISKSPCLTCVAFSDQCGGTTDAAILVWSDRRRSFDRCL